MTVQGTPIDARSRLAASLLGERAKRIEIRKSRKQSIALFKRRKDETASTRAVHRYVQSNNPTNC